MRSRCCFWLGLLLFAITFAHGQKTNVPEEFSGAVTESLMRQIHDGLIAGNAETVLGVFDSQRMSDYAGFAEQLRSFLGKWDNVRVYYQVMQSETANCGDYQCGTAQVQFQMEGNDAQGQSAPMRRNARLLLTIQRGRSGWKITNFTPRELFR